MQTIIEATEYIRTQLEKAMESLTFRWKRSENPAEYQEVKPVVEAFTFDDTTDGFPSKTPSILVQPVSEANNTWHFVIYIACVSPGVQDLEITTPVEGAEGVYEYSESEDFTSSCSRKELLKLALLLTEQVALAIKRLSNNDNALRISNIQTAAPSPMLPDWPYSTATVEFDYTYTQTKAVINTDLAALL